MKYQNKSLPSFCTSNEDVINSIINFCKKYKLPILIESTSNQVNQFGGYSKLKPSEFKRKIEKLSKNNLFPKKNIIFGGDHLGPLPWKKLDKKIAMNRAKNLVKLYFNSKFNKLHIDTTIKLKNDKTFNKEIIKNRSKKLLSNLNNKYTKKLILVLGSEVPPAGGGMIKRKYNKNLENEIISEIHLYKKIFKDLKVKNKLNLVVDPGLSFNDTKVFKSKNNVLKFLKKISKLMNVEYEAHSTDYQSLLELKKLVKSNFKFLKVGPELTYNFTNAILKMSKIEKKYTKNHSDIKNIILKTLKQNKKNWMDYYNRADINKVLIGKFDRLRYYWNDINIKKAKNKLFQNIDNLDKRILLRDMGIKNNNQVLLSLSNESNSTIIINSYIFKVLQKYYKACNYKI